jgi:hypothetical protein
MILNLWLNNNQKFNKKMKKLRKRSLLIKTVPLKRNKLQKFKKLRKLKSKKKNQNQNQPNQHGQLIKLI